MCVCVSNFSAAESESQQMEGKKKVARGRKGTGMIVCVKVGLSGTRRDAVHISINGVLRRCRDAEQWIGG